MLIVILVVVACIVCMVCAFSGGSNAENGLMEYELIFDDRRLKTVVTSEQELQMTIGRIEKDGSEFIAKRRLN